MAQTSIEWTERTWNPVTGCTPVSEGCANCYAERYAKWLQAMGQPRYRDGFKVTLHPEALEEPLRWRKSCMVFVCSMGDPFHEDVPFDFVDRVYGTMAVSRHLTYQVLTKRIERAADYLNRGNCEHYPRETDVHIAMEDRGWQSREDILTYAPPGSIVPDDPVWPLQNVWLGTSIENQKRADERIPWLLKCPAAVRFISCEPLLGPIKLGLKSMEPTRDYEFSAAARARIHWVIVGGESGPGARPMDLDWARRIRDDCAAAGVPFFMKQTGGRHRKGNKLDDLPEDLRIREWPDGRVPSRDRQ